MLNIVKAKLAEKRKASVHRKNLALTTWEGVPAVIYQTLLGGQFLTGFLLYLGATSGELGLVLSMTTFVNILQIAAAYFTQRMKSRRLPLLVVTILQRIFWGLTGVIPWVLPKPWWVVSFIVIYTVAFAFNTVSAMLWSSLMSDLVPARVRGRYFGIRNTLLNAIGALFLFGGGILLDHMEAGSGFLVLYAIAWICLIADAILFFFYPDLPFERSDETKFWPLLQRPLRDRSFIGSTSFLAVFLFLQNLIVPLYPFIMLKRLDLNYQMVSLMSIAQTVFMMASFYVWGNLNARYSNKRLLFWTLPPIALSCLTWGFVTSMPGIAVLLVAHALLGIGIGGFNQLAFNFMIGDTPKKDRPMYMATYAALTGFMSFFGPLIGGKLQEGLNDAPSWAGVYGVQLVVGILMLALTVTLGRRILYHS